MEYDLVSIWWQQSTEESISPWAMNTEQGGEFRESMKSRSSPKDHKVEKRHFWKKPEASVGLIQI